MFFVQFEMSRKALEAEKNGKFRLPQLNILDYHSTGRQRSLCLDEGDEEKNRESAEIIEGYLEGLGCQVATENQDNSGGDSRLPAKKSQRPHGKKESPSRVWHAV